MQRSAPSTVRAMAILAVLFFLFGFVTWLNSTLIPYLKLACQLTTFEAMLVATAFYIAYFVMALPAGKLLERVGYKNGMTIGLFVMALGALVFIPAAMLRTYPLFLLGLFIIGTGLTVLQTASNPYATIIGPIESAAARISILGICNKLAGVIAPLIMGAIMLKNADAIEASLPTLDAAGKDQLLNELAARVIVPYGWMALALVVLALGLRMAPLPPIAGDDDADATVLRKGSALDHPQLVLGVIALFLYVGVEVIAVDTIGTYGRSVGVSMDHAKLLPSYTLLAMVICYIAGIIAVPRFIKQSTALLVSAMLGVVLTACVVFVPLRSLVHLPGLDMDHFTLVMMDVPVSVLLVALLGFANALMWPAIWPLAIDGLGVHTKTGAAFLIMAILGGALLPPLYGALAGESAEGHHIAYWIMIPCYLFILWYGLSGHKRKSWA